MRILTRSCVAATLLVILSAGLAEAQDKKFVIGGGVGVGTIGASGHGTSGPDFATDFHIGYQPTPVLALTWSSKTLFDRSDSGLNVGGFGIGVSPRPRTVIRGVVGMGHIFDSGDGVTRFGTSIGVEQKVAPATYIGVDYVHGRFEGIGIHGLMTGVRFARR